MKKQSKEIVYINNHQVGTFLHDTFHLCNKDEKEKFYQDILNEVIQKDCNRKLSVLVIGIEVLFAAIGLLLILIANGKLNLFTYTFILAALVLLWLILYYVAGFIFYSKTEFNFSFKSDKTNSSARTYASSNYEKWIHLVQPYLSETNFVITNKKRKTLVPFCQYDPSSFKNKLIFNGKINTSVPYYYFSYKGKRYCFLPGMLIIVDGKKSQIISNDKIKASENNNHYIIKNDDKLLLEFDCEGEFSINFFYFKYEQ